MLRYTQRLAGRRRSGLLVLLISLSVTLLSLLVAAGTRQPQEAPAAGAGADEVALPPESAQPAAAESAPVAEEYAVRVGNRYPFPLVWPAPGLISSYFHERGPWWVGGYHQGIDLAAQWGDKVYAAADGVVLEAKGGWNRGYGTHIIVDHGNGLHTLYAHLSQLGVEAGQRVRRGQLIGRVGSSGAADGPHLHFEVRMDGKLDDPLAYLPRKRPQLDAAALPRAE